MKTLQSGLIFSTLLLWTSQQVGTTFGEFTSVREDHSEIKACRVFPSQIENQLSLLAEHLERAASLKGRLLGSAVTPPAYNPSATDLVYDGGEGTNEFEAGSRLGPAAAGLSARIGELNAMIQQLEQQKALNQSIWQELQRELAAASAPVHELLTSLNELEPNCAELSQTTLLDRITDLLERSGLHSGSLSGTLQEILSYLRSVHQLGSLTSDGFAADSYATAAFFDGRVAIDGDPAGEELLAYFESVQASLQSAIAGLTAGISSLEAQRAQLLPEAEAQRPAEIERQKQLQEEQAKQEEQAGEKEPAAPDGSGNPSDGETPPPGDKQAVKDKTPAEGDIPTVSETGDGETPLAGEASNEKTPTAGESGGGDVRIPADSEGGDGDEPLSSAEQSADPNDSHANKPSPPQPERSAAGPSPAQPEEPPASEDGAPAEGGQPGGQNLDQDGPGQADSADSADSADAGADASPSPANDQKGGE
ncbi:hypothetical protein P4H42_22705 [Paenibacillus macerans]|uniref:hypothetical protein n=1 Tax=Paenibacillus macerans TaxID=44252 RepID=UPI002DB9ECB4|nr:hypothetical protein [Paenibacillus macerans]MEC0332413.1 hypothetical protein [Paenibacillus macerans]